MPKLGMTMQEARIVEWHAGDGDWVEKGDVLFTIETEKTALDIEAPASGVLEILVPAGETVGVLETVAALLPAAHDRKEATADDHAGSARLVQASPKARAVARREGLSLDQIQGSGPRGMIVLADLEAHRQAQGAPERTARISPVARRVAERAGVEELGGIPGSGPRGRIMRDDVERALASRDAPVDEPTPVPEAGIGAAATPLSGLRAIISERLSASWRERPHVTLITEVDASHLVSAREQINAEGERKVSYNALLVKLVARALREHPHMNVRLIEGGIERQAEVNIGVAVDTDRGLLVPVVRAADTRGLLQIQRALEALVERATAGQSLPDELTGGTFTITNLGMYEIDAFTPIINPPESAILGVGRIVAKPVVVAGQVVVRDRMALSLSFDHRVVDGAPAARFLQRVKQLIERPFILILDDKSDGPAPVDRAPAG
jgi:pyruvate dehydrogenase E2 component (dihydrolipoamide acetyltransferase)